MAFSKLMVKTLCKNYHNAINCINEFINTYDAFCSVLMGISTVDFNIITGFLE